MLPSTDATPRSWGRSPLGRVASEWTCGPVRHAALRLESRSALGSPGDVTGQTGSVIALSDPARTGVLHTSSPVSGWS